MARFEFPQSPANGAETTNDLTGVTYIYDSSTQTWTVSGTAAEDGFARTVDLQAEQASRIAGDNSLSSRIDDLEENGGGGEVESDPTLPYQLTVGERDSITGEDVSSLQILETIALKDALGNSLGDVAFESGGGMGIAISNTFAYPVIKFQTTTIQDSTKYNKGRIYAEELRSGVVPRTYNIVNRNGIPTARPGELSTDQQKPDNVTAISFGETSKEGLPIGNVSVGDTLCITKISQGRKYFYSITSGTTNSGIYGVSFIAADSWENGGNLQNEEHYLEIFPRDTSFGSNIDLGNYYNKSEIDTKFAAGLMPGDVDANDYYTKQEVNTAIESFRAHLAEQVDQNEEQLQAISTTVFNLLNDASIKAQELAQAKLDIIDLQSKVLSLEQQTTLDLE